MRLRSCFFELTRVEYEAEPRSSGRQSIEASPPIAIGGSAGRTLVEFAIPGVFFLLCYEYRFFYAVALAPLALEVLY